MVKEVKVSELRKLLGIKRVRKNIQISQSQKAQIKLLREEEKRRLVHPEKLKA